MWPTTRDAIPMWEKGYWDGPLNGVATVRGRWYWFEIAAMTVDGGRSGRRYLLFEMTPEEIEQEQQHHALWEKEVGTHLCYHLTQAERRVYGPRLDEGWDGYLKRFRRLFPETDPDYRRLAGREPDFEVTWQHGELSRQQRGRPTAPTT